MNRQFNKRWHSPASAYVHLQKVSKEDEKRPQYKGIREARISAVLSFVLSKIRGLPTFFRLPEQDPPDAYLMQPNKGTMDITTVELTSYRGLSKETLLEQLIRTGKLSKAYSKEYLMVIHLFTDSGVEYGKINDYAVKNDVEFPLWTVRNIQSSPDTLAEVVTMNPEVTKFEINIGEEAFNYSKKYSTPDVVFSKKVSKIEDVRIEKNEKKCNIAPWEERQS